MTSAPDSLAPIKLFRQLNPEARRGLERACLWRRVAAKTWILDYQAPSTDVFFVLQGEVRVLVNAAGKETILRDIRAGEYFGELAALDGQPRSAGILALTDVLVARMPAPVFRAAIHAHTDICDQVLAVLVSQIRMLANRANETSAFTVKQRLWAELLRLARPAAEGHLMISPPPTHAEMAARVGTHREAITRELNALQRAGLITRRPTAIVLLDATRLRSMIETATAQ